MQWYDDGDTCWVRGRALHSLCCATQFAQLNLRNALICATHFILRDLFAAAVPSLKPHLKPLKAVTV